MFIFLPLPAMNAAFSTEYSSPDIDNTDFTNPLALPPGINPKDIWFKNSDASSLLKIPFTTS